tara:strand:+ start:45 stop:1295 length:1251 start_codon:yes stop_codon:yes gene_type:complete
MKKILLAFVLLFLTLSFSQNLDVVKNPELYGVSKSRLKTLNDVLHKFVDEKKISGIQTAIFRKGNLVHSDTYGYSDIETKKPLKENSIYRLASMTKPIVSVALMMLYEKGNFHLDDPLEKYIPWFKSSKIMDSSGEIYPALNKIRIIDLLRHTSGIGSDGGIGYINSLYREINREEQSNNETLVKEISGLPLYFEPGTKWKYGLSTTVCGYLIEVLSKKPLDEFLRERIFIPLGMKDTFFEIPSSKYNRFVTSYTIDENQKLQVLDHPLNSFWTKKVTLFRGGGGLVSTMKDYLIFSQMLLNKGKYNKVRLLGRKTIELMTSNHTMSTPNFDGKGLLSIPNLGKGFGLGFSVVTNPAETKILNSKGTYGWGGAFGTYFQIDPKEELIYIMMIQRRPYSELKLREYFQNLVYQSLTD